MSALIRLTAGFGLFIAGGSGIPSPWVEALVVLQLLVLAYPDSAWRIGR